MRKVKVDHANPPLWRSLNKEQKMRHSIFCSYLIQYCEQNKDEYIPWSQIDENIPHIYSFVFDNYNSSHQKTKIIYDKIGVKIISVGFNFEQQLVDSMNKFDEILENC